MKNVKFYNDDNLNIMAKMPNESIDVICIDPPYLYLKNQKLERVFDEDNFFAECKRLLTKNGFMVMFGRGVSFYRWNTILDSLNFEFKEEIVWDKSQSSSPLMKVSRVHETVSIFTKGKGVINKVKVPYIEIKKYDIGSLVTDVKRFKSGFNNTSSFDAVLEFLENNNLVAKEPPHINQVTNSNLTKPDRCASIAKSIQDGITEKTIIRTDRISCDTFSKHNVTSDKRKSGDRCVNTIQSLEFGLTEKTIIKQVRDHYTSIHPTQKPVRLLERLLALVIPSDKPIEEIVVADFFAGSMSCMEAVLNMGMKGIAVEIDEEYFKEGKNRIETLIVKLEETQITLFA